MRVHHLKHHQTYTDNTNAVLGKLRESPEFKHLAKMGIDTLLTKLDQLEEDDRRMLRNQYVLLFTRTLRELLPATPPPSSAPLARNPNPSLLVIAPRLLSQESVGFTVCSHTARIVPSLLPHLHFLPRRESWRVSKGLVMGIGPPFPPIPDRSVGKMMSSRAVIAACLCMAPSSYGHVFTAIMLCDLLCW